MESVSMGPGTEPDGPTEDAELYDITHSAT